MSKMNPLVITQIKQFQVREFVSEVKNVTSNDSVLQFFITYHFCVSLIKFYNKLY